MARRVMPFALAFCLALALPLIAATYNFITINPFLSVETSARGINDTGDVVGDFATAAQANAQIESGFLLHEGKFTKIIFPGVTDNDANGVNNEGDVVGTYDNSSGDHGYVFSEGEYIPLPDPPVRNDGFPDFSGINDEGDIVGNLLPVPFPVPFGFRGFLFSEGVYTVIDCGHDSTEANGINDDGDIVGECSDSTTPFATHGFLLRDGKFYLIDFPGAAHDTVAFGINENGDIAGTYTDSNGNEHGFVVKGFPEQPKWQSVEAPGATDTKVAGINLYGNLVGTTTTNGQDKGFKARK